MSKEEVSIGNKLKSLRKLKQISSEDLASRANLSLDYYKAIEDESEIPPVGDLLKIVRVLGIRLGTLLDDEMNEGPVVSRAVEDHTYPVIRGRNSSQSEISYFSLSQKKRDRHMETFSVSLQPYSGKKNVSSHEGEEFLYVLEGKVEILYGKQTYILDKDDSIYYDSIVPHYIGSASESEGAKILAVIYVPV